MSLQFDFGGNPAVSVMDHVWGMTDALNGLDIDAQSKSQIANKLLDACAIFADAHKEKAASICDDLFRLISEKTNGNNRC